MSKHSSEFKLQVVQEALTGSISINSIAKKHHISKSDVLKWTAAYKEHGVAGLCTKNGTYTGDFKVSVVEYMRNTSLSARQTAAYFNIPSYTTVCNWERIYLEEGIEALFKDNRGRPKGMSDKIKNTKTVKKTDANEDLIAEVQRLRMENAYLKKLNALIQDRERSKNTIK